MDLDRRAHAHAHAHAYAHHYDRDRLLLDPSTSKRSSSPAPPIPLGSATATNNANNAYTNTDTTTAATTTTTTASSSSSSSSSSADRLQLAFALNSSSDVHQSSPAISSSSTFHHHQQPAPAPPPPPSATPITAPVAQGVLISQPPPVSTSFVSVSASAATASGPSAISCTVASAASLPSYPTAPTLSQSSSRREKSDPVHSDYCQEQQACSRNPTSLQIQTDDYTRPQTSSREQVYININSQPPRPPPQPSQQHSNSTASSNGNIGSITSNSSKDSAISSNSGSGHPFNTRPATTSTAHATTTTAQHVFPSPPQPPPPSPPRPSLHLAGAPLAAPSASPSMSHLSQSAGPARQHSQQPPPQQNGASPTPHHQQHHAVSYAPPAPHHYAPAGHTPQPQYGYPTPGGQPMDQYRPSPSGPPQQQHPPPALPGLRTFDQQLQGQAQGHPQHYQPHPQQQPYQQVQHHAQHNPYSPQLHMQQGGPIGSTMAPGPHVGYFSIQPQQYMHDPMGMRYGLPPGMYDPRMQLSGGRHKKEIKRRTKTGCLTCRKRRIKCDETHPTCNNCKKSKRDCLGYDPIFKQQQQQQQQTPTTLQSASSGNISPPASVTDSVTPLSASAAPYTTHPTPVLTPSEPTSATSDPSDIGTAVKVEASDIELKTGANIDPALPASFASSAHAGPDSGNPANNSTNFSQQQSGDALHLRGGGSPFSLTSSSPNAAPPSLSPSPFLSYNPPPPPPPPPPPHPSAHTSASTHAYSTAPVKMKVDEIINTAGAPPPTPETGSLPNPQSIEELTKIYYEIYVPGLCQFFESQWFNFKTNGHNPVTILLSNRSLISLMGSFLVSLHTVNSEPPHAAYCNHLETRVVWALAKLAYSVSPGTNMPRDDPPPDDNASEARNRVFVFETLVAGEDLLSNPLLPPPRNADPQRRAQYEFWYALAEFLRNGHNENNRGVTSNNPTAERHTQLARMRASLDGRENRDVLYSLAVIRLLGKEFEPGWENRVPDHLNEKEPLNQLHVAIQFIKNEAQPTGGTTNVVRQLAYVAGRSLINPGLNVEKKG